MTYELEFHPDAYKEWNKLAKAIREQFKKVLERRLLNPHVPKAKLSGKLKNCYKIKLLNPGYCLVYHVKEQQLVITVIAVGKRENNSIYNVAEKRQ